MMFLERIKSMRIRVLYELPLRIGQYDKIHPEFNNDIPEMPGLREGLAELGDFFVGALQNILEFLSNLNTFHEVIGLDPENYQFQELRFMRYEQFEQIDNVEYSQNYFLFWRHLRHRAAPGILIDIWLENQDMRKVLISNAELLYHAEDLIGYLLKRIENAINPQKFT